MRVVAVDDALVGLVGEEQRLGVPERRRDRIEVVRPQDITRRVDGRVDDREGRVASDRGAPGLPVGRAAGSARADARAAADLDHLREEERWAVADRAGAERGTGEVEALHATEGHEHLAGRVNRARELAAQTL